MSDWQPIAAAPEGELVETKIDDQDGIRNQQILTRRGRLWFTCSASGPDMYVYYTPTHWRPFP